MTRRQRDGVAHNNEASGTKNCFPVPNRVNGCKSPRQRQTNQRANRKEAKFDAIPQCGHDFFIPYSKIIRGVSLSLYLMRPGSPAGRNENLQSKQDRNETLTTPRCRVETKEVCPATP